jgi:MFS superfamily sulfate permease-like transporter
MSYREFLMSASTTLGVLVLGVLPGVLLAVTLSLIWLLSVASRPNDAVLGRVPGQKGFHNVADYPEAKTIPGLLLYRFESNVVFFNADYLKTRMRAAIAAQKTPVEWVVIDASPVNVIDVTGLRKLDELRQELAAAGISVYFARVKRHLERFFNVAYAKERRQAAKKYRFQTLKPAVRAYLKHQKAKGVDVADTEMADSELDARQWREPAQPPRTDRLDAAPIPREEKEPDRSA